MTDPASGMPRKASWHRRCVAVTIVLFGIGLAGCGSQPKRSSDLPAPPSAPAQDGAPINPPDVMKVPDAVPRVEPRSRYGNPESYVVFGKTYRVLPHGLDYVERGGASWYGTKFHGQRTSSGEPYDLYAMTAAHKSLPLPSYARVTNLANNASVVVRINDRGPFHPDRIIDLSYTAAMKLGIFGHGTGTVEVRAIDLLAAQNPRAYGAGFKTALSDKRRPIKPRSIPGDPGLFAQAGAFRTENKSADLIARLRQAGFTGLRITPSGKGKDRLYRVLIGPLENAEAMTAMEARLTRFGIDNPSIENAETRLPASLAESVYLQVGAYSSFGNASDEVERLQRAAIGSARVARSNKNNQTLYRVLVGPLASAEEARQMGTRLSSVGIENPRVVKD